ncbi:ribonuclease H-like domain-containing protein [Tanacetum coccineum]
MAGSDDENPPPPPPTSTPQAPHTLSTIKLPILKKGNGPVSVSTDTNGVIKVFPPKTAKEILARERERKARTTLLMALPEDHLAKFHKMTDAKEMWEAIKPRFGGNDKSKKMQKYILKQQFEGFSVSNSEGLHKGYDRSLPSSWSQVSLVMRTKPGVDSLSFDDLYNNLRVFESDVKGSTGSSSSTQNVAFVSSESTNSTNDVSTAASTSSGYNPQRNSSSYTDEVDEFDLEEMDLKWQVAMISMRLKKFYKKTRRKLQFDAKEPVGFDKTKVECFNCKTRNKDNGRRPGKHEEPKALITLDGEGVDWTSHSEDEQENFALMAYSKCRPYTKFMEIDLDDKTDVFIYHKKLLAKAVKEKEELKTKLEKWQNSSKGLNKLLNSQMSAKDKTRLGYRDQIHGMNNENDVLESVFESRSRDTDDSPVYDRFAKFKGMHAVPPLMIGNFMPPKSDFGIDESKFTYGPNQFKTSKSDAKTSDFDSCEANSSIETLESVPKPVINEPKVVSEPRVWSDAPIIEEYESDSDNEYVITPSKEQKKPSYAFVNTVEHVKTPRETVKEQNTYSQSPKVDQRNWNGLKYKTPSLGYGLTRKACFVCGSLGHLIRDYDFLKKRMAKQVELNKKTGKGTGHREISVVGGNRETAVKASAGYNWRSKRHYWERVSKYNSGSMTSKSVDVKDPQGRLKSAMAWIHKDGENKSYLVEYQEFNGGSVAFGWSEGKITGKGPKEANTSTCIKDDIDAGNFKREAKSVQEYFVLPVWSSFTSTVKSSEANNGGEKPKGDTGSKTNEEPVYKVKKALYGLHQAPRAWYATLSTFLLKNSYRRGTIDKTLFIKKDKDDIMLVQVYVDDIIFGSTKKSWCDEFEVLMKSQFQISSMGELTFFLGLQTANTSIETQRPLVKDEEAAYVNVHHYESMIGSLMYLTAFRPDIMFAVCACSRFQVTPKTSHLNAVKRIFMYLKGKLKLGLWYPRESSFDLEAFSNSDYAGANLDRKSITGGCQFLGKRLILWQCKKQTIVATSTTEAESSMDFDDGGKLVTTTRHTYHCWVTVGVDNLNYSSMADLKFVKDHNMVSYFIKIDGNEGFHQIVDFLIRSHIYHTLTVSPTIYISNIEQFWNTASLRIVNDERYSDAIVENKPIVLSEASSYTSVHIYADTSSSESKGSKNPPEFQPTFAPTPPSVGDQTPVQTPSDSPLSGGPTSDRAEGGMNLPELFVLCTNLPNRVLALESTKAAQAKEIKSLKQRVKALESNKRARA